MHNPCRRSLLELVDLFERSSAALPGAQGERLHGVPAWEFGRLRALTPAHLQAWTQRIGDCACYLAPRGDGYVDVDLEPDEAPQTLRYRCPESFVYRRIPASAVGVHAVRQDRLAHHLADLLEIAQALRGGIECAAIEGVLWRLGRMRLGATGVDVWLARGLCARLREVFEHLSQPALPPLGLVLSCGVTPPEIITPPRDYRFLALSSALRDDGDNAAFDLDLIARVLQVPYAAAKDVAPLSSAVSSAKSSAVSFDRFTHTLVLGGRANATWQVRGERQIAAVRFLFEQFQRGRTLVPAGEILQAVYGQANQGRSRRISSLFKGNSVWRDFIASDGRGNYGFRLD